MKRSVLVEGPTLEAPLKMCKPAESIPLEGFVPMPTLPAERATFEPATDQRPTELASRSAAVRVPSRTLALVTALLARAALPTLPAAMFPLCTAPAASCIVPTAPLASFALVMAPSATVVAVAEVLALSAFIA